MKQLQTIFSAMVFTGVSLAMTATGAGAGEPGLMQGFPPAPEQQVLRTNFMVPPNNRWAFQHIRELQPTREVWRGDGPVSKLSETAADLGKITAAVRDGRIISLDQLLEESHTDAFLILHHGKLVFERYMNGQQRHTQHQMFSATKSFVGTLMLLLIEQGRVDPARTVASYVPELEDSGFGDATVQQVLDMTSAIAYSEVYDDPNSDIWRYGWVFGLWGAPPAGYDGPLTVYGYLPTLKKQGEHGHGFHYVTPNTDVLGWIIRRVTGKSVDHNIEEVLWQPLGAERDGYIWLDAGGTEMAGGGLNITARDAARFGQMILQGGKFNGRQILPAAVTTRILQHKGDPEVFTRIYSQFEGTEWYGTIAYAYHDQWWTCNNAHKAVSAIGVHGQYIYLDPVANMVVVKQSSSPDAEGGANESNDTDGPLLYQALAEQLMKR
ncbi:MAG: serine hydrolase [Gammaproteobacteria bacterium]|nr:serine hydrolase [Gammaproteobacteria bacterium]